MPRILIFHYHLNPGGVTRIIESQVKCLNENYPGMDIWLISGACRDDEVFRRYKIRLIIHEKLNYLTKIPPDLAGEYHELESFIASLVHKEDLLHIHNLNLGKNPLLTLVMFSLAIQGYKVLNHCHDFAEDRPVNLRFMKNIIRGAFGKDLHEVMYPSLKNYYFAVLNTSDKHRIEQSGIKPEQFFLLPNPVEIEHSDTSHAALKIEVCEKLGLDPQKKIMTYPVRAIRRKNIGEFILLSILIDREAHWLITRPPNTPAEIRWYKKWVQFCTENNLNIIFEAGEKVQFEKLIRVSDFCITTSIREGFGMVFLEPWLMNTPVAGRNLPEITEDFKRSGIILSGLYEKLYINTENRLIDFGTLHEDKQRLVIRDLLDRSGLAGEVKKINPFLDHFPEPVAEEEIEKNKKIIENTYSLKKYAKRLEGIYKKIAG